MRVADLVMATIILTRLIDHEEIWKWKVFGAVGCMNNEDFEEKKL